MATHPQQIASARPIPGVMYGITHAQDGSLIVREPRILKIGIGLPKGPALSVWMQREANGVVKWKITRGFKNDGPDAKKTLIAETRQQAEEIYRRNIDGAPQCPYPRKIGYFTFTRPTLASDGKTELFEPDFEAIEMHGPTPTEIDIVFLDDDPFNGAYQMWSAAELKCKGDGINAMRVVTMATADQKPAAELATASGEKFFPIENGCWTCGCQYTKEAGPNKPSPCKPGGDLKFQLARNIRVGGTAYFHTTGFRSISQIFSAAYRIKTLTGGRLAGIPLKMCLRPYKTTHNGQVATQYGVSLEFRAEDMEALRRGLIDQAMSFRRLVGSAPSLNQAPVRMIDTGNTPEDMAITLEDDDAPTGSGDTPISAAAMASEFYPDQAEPEPATETTKASTQAAEATATASQGLAEKLKTARSRASAKPEPAAQPAAAPQAATQQQAAPAASAPQAAAPAPGLKGTDDDGFIF